MRVQGSTLDSVQTTVVADSENKLKIWAERMSILTGVSVLDSSGGSKHSREEIYLQNREKIFGKQPYAVFL